MNPKISVIITTYNRAALLSRAVNSVLAQTYDDYEIIIVDDCSSDNTPEVVADLTIHPRIRAIRHDRNRRASAARNTGIADARGEYIALLDDDDEWLPRKLELQVRLLDASSPKVGMVYGWSYTIRDSSGRLIPNRQGTREGDLSEDLLSLRCPTGTSSLLLRASAVRAVGGFDERYTYNDDTNFICRISQDYHIAVLPEIIQIYRVDHEYDRISHDTSGLIEAIEMHMKDFANHIEEHSNRNKILAGIYFRRFLPELFLGYRREGVKTYLTALRLDPVGIVRDTLRRFPAVSKAFVWYASPLRHFRDMAKTIRDRMRR